MSMMFYLSTSFFSKITDLIDDYVQSQMKQQNMKSYQQQLDGWSKEQNELLAVPPFAHILTEIYKQTLKGGPALQGKSESQIRSQVMKDLRMVAQKMIDGVMKVIYKDAY